MKPMSPRLELQLLLDERGFMLVASLLVTAVIVTLGLAVSFTAMNNSLIARNVSEITQSRYQADGGIDAVIGYLRSGEAPLTFNPPNPGATIYVIDENALQGNVNNVLGNLDLGGGTVTILGNTLKAPTPAPQSLSAGSPPASPTGPAITPSNGWKNAIANSNSPSEGSGCYSDGSDGFAAAPGHTYRLDNRNNSEGMLVYIKDPATNKTTEIKFDPSSPGADTRQWYAHPTRSGNICSQNMSCEAYDLNGNPLPGALFDEPFGGNTAAMGSCLCTSDTTPPASGNLNKPGTGGCPTFSTPPTIACGAGGQCGGSSAGSPYPPSSVYVTLNSRFEDPTIGTVSNRNATVELKIDWNDTSNTTPSYGIQSDKGCAFNSSATINVGMYCGTGLTNNNTITTKDGKLPSINVSSNISGCNSPQQKEYCINVNEREFALKPLDKGGLGIPAVVFDDPSIKITLNKAQQEKLYEAIPKEAVNTKFERIPYENPNQKEVTVEIPTPEQVRDVTLDKLRNELNIPAAVQDFGAYISANKVVISPNQVDQNSSSQFDTSLKAAIKAAGGGNDGCSKGTVLYLTGGINIPGGVNLTNCIFVVQKGDLNFNGSANHTNTVFINEKGGMNFNGEHTYDNSALIAGGRMNINNTPIFKDANSDGKSFSVLSTNKGLNLNGAFKEWDAATELYIVSQKEININNSAEMTAGIIAGGDIRFNGNGGLAGFARAKGSVTMNGGIDTKDFSDPFRTKVTLVFPVFTPDKSPPGIVTRQ